MPHEVAMYNSNAIDLQYLRKCNGYYCFQNQLKLHIKCQKSSCHCLKAMPSLYAHNHIEEPVLFSGDLHCFIRTICSLIENELHFYPWSFQSCQGHPQSFQRRVPQNGDVLGAGSLRCLPKDPGRSGEDRAHVKLRLLLRLVLRQKEKARVCKLAGTSFSLPLIVSLEQDIIGNIEKHKSECITAQPSTSPPALRPSISNH